MSCTILKSKLLEIVKDESEATKLYSYFETNQFKEIFYGNESPTSNPDYFVGRINDQYEPVLHYNSVTNTHYFLDKDNEPVYYPYSETGLKKFILSKDIKDFAKSLAYGFYTENLQLNTDTFELTNSSKEQLSAYIYKELNNTINTLSSSKIFLDKYNARMLEKTKDHLDEWYKEVVTVFNKHKIDIIEDELSEIEEQAEEIRGEVVRKESFLKSFKSNASENIKLFLSFIPSDKLNKFKRQTFEEFDDVFNTLNSNLYDIVAVVKDNTLEDEFQMYLDTIEDLIERKPYLEYLHNELLSKKDDKNFKAQFVNAFRLTKNKFLTSEYIRNKNGELKHSSKNVSDVTSLSNNIINQWFFNLKQLDLQPYQFKEIEKSLNNLILEFGKKLNNNSITTEEQALPYYSGLLEILNKLGVTQINQKSFDYFLDDFKKDTSFKQRVDNFLELTTNLNRIFDLKDKIKSNENIFKSQSVLVKLAKAQSFFIPDGSDASIFALGKSKWVYSLPSFLVMKINQWKKNPELLLQHLENSEFNRSSHWGKYLLALDESIEDRNELRKQRLEELELFIFNSVQESGDSMSGLENKEMGLTDALADYVNKLLGFKTGKKVYHKTALAADKSTEYQLSLGNNVMINTNARYSSISENNVVFNDEVLEIFYEYFKSEYDRIAKELKRVKKLNPEELTSNYNSGNKNAFQSQLFPSLAPIYEKGKLISVPKNLGFELYNSKGEPIFTNLDVVKDRIKEQISNIVSKNIITTLDNLTNAEMFKFDKNGVLVNNTIDVDVYNQYLKDSGKNHKLTNLKIAADFFVNNVISQVEYSKLFTGDVAYYKDVTDYKKRVPATYTDGQHLYLDNIKDYNFNIAVIASVEASIPYYNELRDLVGENIASKYLNDVNVADAQAWITPERWKFLLQGLGKWNSVLESAYNKMINSENKESFSEEELKHLGQPLKGVYFNNDNGIPTFLKYSQAVLWPSLIKNNGLETLYNKMVKDSNGNILSYEEQIHELITKDGIKVGSLTPVESHDQFGNVKNTNEFDLNNKITLNNQYWKLQQDLPTKNLHDTQIGSQIQKIIFQGLVYNLNETFNVDGKNIKGSELITELHTLLGELSNKGYNKIQNKLGVSPSTFEIEDEHKLYESLIQQLSKRKDVPDNFINALKSQLSPYGIPGSITMFNNVFSSFVNDNIIKVKTNGGGFIQMSDFGIYKDTLNNQKIIYTPWMNTEKLPTPRLYTDENGKKHIAPGGIFISGSLISKMVPDYIKYTPQQLFVGDENTKPIIDPEFLRNVIGYRIPNQGLSSNDSFEILGILPDAIGDTIIPYTGITKKTGSDYDIDKMYLMVPSIRKIRRNGLDLFRKTGITNQIAKDILKSEGLTNTNEPIVDLYEYLIGLDEFNYLDNTGELKELLDNINNFLIESPVERIEYINPSFKEGVELPIYQQSEKVIQNKLIKSFKAILEHPEVLKSVMEPLDAVKISNDIKNLHPEEKRSDMMDFDALSDLKLKIEFALGKAGLGQNVNSLVDAVRGAMGNLRMMNYHFGKNTNGQDLDIKFDNEFSYKLSKKDVQEYVESYNKREKDPKKHLKLNDALKELSEIKLFDAMMELVNGFVDIAKDPYIVRGNWVTQTNNVGFFMLRSGVHPFYVNAFLGQPILKKYIAFLSNKEAKVTEDINNLIDEFKLQSASELLKDKQFQLNGFDENISDLFKSLMTYSNLKDVILKYNAQNKDETKILESKNNFEKILRKKLISKFNIKGVLNEFESSKIDGLVSELIGAFDLVYNLKNNKKFDDMSLKTLRDNIIEIEDVEVQLSVLSHFLDLQKNHSKKLTKSVKSAKLDVNGKGKNVTNTVTILNTMDTFINPEYNEKDSVLLGGETKMSYDKESTFLNTYHLNIQKIFNIMKNNPKYFITAKPEVINTFNMISQMIKKESLQDEDLGDVLENSFYSYIMSNFKPLQADAQEFKYLMTELPKLLSEKKKQHPNNFLLQKLIINQGEKMDFLSLPNNKLSVHDKNKITDAWKELIRLDESFANDLVKYSYIVTGFNLNPNVLYQYIPHEWFNKNRFNSYLKNINFENEIQTSFIDQFFRHNLKNRKLVKQVFLTDNNSFKISSYDKDTLFTTDENIGHYIYSKKQNEFEEESGFFGFEDVQQSNNERYYKLSGRFVNEDGSLGKFIYNRITPLGAKDNKGNKIYEYDLMKSEKVSRLNSNKVGITIDDKFNIKAIETLSKAKNVTKDVLPLIKLENKVENVQEVKSEVESEVENVQMFKTISNLKEMFNDGLMLNKFNESGINNVDDLNKLSEDELGELLKKICK
jgi:hypothetical protein